MTNVDQMTNVMMAYGNGENVQFRLANVDTTESDWQYISKPTWNWDKYEYRIEPKGNEGKELMTNGQLSELIQKGYGTWSDRSPLEYAHAGLSLSFASEEDKVASDKWIRAWGSKDWIKPTVDIYEEYISKWNRAFAQGNAVVENKSNDKQSLVYVNDYSDAYPSVIEPKVNERFFYKGKTYRCVPSNECTGCAFNNEEKVAGCDCSIFRCYRSNRKDENSVKFVEEW